MAMKSKPKPAVAEVPADAPPRYRVTVAKPATVRSTRFVPGIAYNVSEAIADELGDRAATKVEA